MAEKNNPVRYGDDLDEEDGLSFGFLDVPEEQPEEGDQTQKEPPRGREAGKKREKTIPKEDPEDPYEGRLDDLDAAGDAFSDDLDDIGSLDDGEDRTYLAKLRRSKEGNLRQERRAKRQMERRKEVLQARIILTAVLAGCAVLAVGLVLLVRSRIGTLSGNAKESTAAAQSTQSASDVIGGAAIGTPDFESTAGGTESAEAGSTMPTEAMIEVARTAKNYSEDVKTFWPYDWFYEDDSTKLIPCDAAAAAQAASAAETASQSESEAASEEDTGSTESAGTSTGADPYIIGDGDHTFTSKYGILVNVDTGEIVAEKSPKERIVPASMTKVMTLLVAVEQMTDPESQMQDMVTLTQSNEEYAYVNGSSAVCWMPGDTASVADLMYGTILPSGADAAVALAEYTSGTQDAFVELMNEKAKELGLQDTHFVNCVGCYDENHYSTVYDIAVIMKAAMENDICRKVLSTHTWTTSPTSQHPEGITVSNWFLRRIEDSDNHGTVLCAKTGYVEQSGFCAVSYQIANDGTHYILCSADTYSSWQAIYDHTAMYQEYTN